MKFLEESIIYLVSLLGLNVNSEIWWNMFFAKLLVSVSELSILFLFILFIVQYLMSFVNHEKIKERIGKVSPILSHFFAALFGAVTPFCTCSGVPMFAGFLKTGMPASVAFSFLITSPLVNTIALAGLWTVFGAKVAILYVIFGLLAGVVGGMILSMFNVDHLLIRDLKSKSSCCESETINSCCSNSNNTTESSLSPSKFYNMQELIVSTNSQCSTSSDIDQSAPSVENKLTIAWKETLDILIPVIPYLFLGSAIGIAITIGFSEKMVSFLSLYNSFLMIPVAIIIGAPIYTSTIAVLPVITSLYQGGLGIGVCFALLMSIGGMSFPEWTLLSRMMNKKLLFLFIGVTGMLIMLVSFLFSILDIFQLL